MSGRLDAFFSLTLCHSAVACVLFAGALSFYAPLATSYYQLVSLTAFLYWLVVLFILTLLTTTIQLVMRMVRVGSGQLLQRYRRVGVLLANPQPVSHDWRRRPTSQSLAYNNSSNASWSGRLRRLTELSRQNNNNNNNNDEHDDNDYVVDDSIAMASSGFAVPLRPRLSGSVPSRQDATQRRSLSHIVRRLSYAHLYKSTSPTAGLSKMTNRFLIVNECSSVSCSLGSHEDKVSGLRLKVPQPALSSSSTAALASRLDNAGDAEVEGILYRMSEPYCSSRHPREAAVVESVDTAAESNTNNNNNKRDSSHLVSVTVQSSRYDHNKNVSSNVGHDQENYSSNAGAEDVPTVTRRGSATRPSRQSSAVEQPVAGTSRASAGQSIAAPRRSSTGQSTSEEARRSSAAARQSEMETRRSSAGQEATRSSREWSEAGRASAGQSIAAPRKSSTGQSISEEPRRSSAAARQSEMETRRSSAGQEATRSSRELSIADRRSSTGQSLSQEARRSSAAERESGMEPRRSSVGQEASRRLCKGLDMSDEAARRSSAVSAAEMGGRQSAGELSRGDRESAGVMTDRRGSSASSQYCCAPVTPPSSCSSCCRPAVRPHTCWCRCENEIHDPDLLGDCDGSRDGRLLSLPGFPRTKPTCNSCFTPCKPLPPLCSKTPTCEPRCRFTSRRDCSCACPCEQQDAASDCSESGALDVDSAGKSGTGVVGSLVNKLGLSRSENQAPRGSASSKSSFRSMFNRRSSAGNMSRNNPALRFASSRFSPLPVYNRSSVTRPFAGPSTFNTSTNSSAAFDVYWSHFWDQIAPHRDAAQLPSTFDNISLTELKSFTGHLIESVIAKLKAQYAQPPTKSVTNSSAPRGTTQTSMREADIEAVCRDILCEMMRDRTSTTTGTCDDEPTIVEPSEPCDESAPSLNDEDATDDDDDEDDDEDEQDDDLRSDLLLDDACLREFASRVVEGLYTAMRRKLQDADNRNDGDDNCSCSNLVANADNEIRSHVRSLYTVHQLLKLSAPVNMNVCKNGVLIIRPSAQRV